MARELTTRSLAVPSHVMPKGGNVRMAGTNRAPLWCLADLCRILDIGNPSEVAARLDSDEKSVMNLNTLDLTEGIPEAPLRGNPNATFVNESGFYATLLRSDKPEAKPFRKWVTSEVLPSIREHGCYPPPAAKPIPDDPLLALIDAMRAEREKELADGSSPANVARRLALIESKLIGSNGVKAGKDATAKAEPYVTGRAQAKIVAALKAAGPDGMTCPDLSDVINEAQPSVRVALNRFHDAGLTERHRNTWVLTAAGLAACPA